SSSVPFCSVPYPCSGSTPTHPPTLSLHDALPILPRNLAHQQLGIEGLAEAADGPQRRRPLGAGDAQGRHNRDRDAGQAGITVPRSEEHTSELQSPCNLVCRPPLEKKPVATPETEL